MKTLTFLILGLILGLGVYAQAPQAFKYQAVARDASGNVLANKNVSFRISIIQGTVTGDIVYSELHSATTNSFGLCDLEIGKGTSPSGTFSAINWGVDVHSIKVEMDPNGGTAYQNMGTSQLLSVPYALYAKDVLNKDDADADPTNELQTISISGTMLTLSKGGGSVTLPSSGGGDNWGTQAVVTDATLAGNGTPATPLKIAQQLATNGQVLKWNGTSWLPSADLGSVWSQNGSNIFYNTGKVGVGKDPGTDGRRFQVLGTDEIALAAENNSANMTMYLKNSGSGPAAEFRNTSGPVATFRSNLVIQDGTQGDGRILTSDANGVTSWKVLSGTGDNWGSQTVVHDFTLSGTGTTTSPLMVADNGITSVKIADNSIQTADLVDNAVTSAKIATGAVTSDDLAASAVITDKINNSAVTGAKIAQAGATTGQALKWNGTTWAPADDATGSAFTLPYTGTASSATPAFQVTNNTGDAIKGIAVGTNSGVIGYNSATSNVAYGIQGLVDSPDGRGVHGYNSASSGTGYGVLGESNSSGGYGIYGKGYIGTAGSGHFGVIGYSSEVNGYGIYGSYSSSANSGGGVYGQSASTSGFGVKGQSTASSGTNYGVYGISSSSAGVGVYGDGQTALYGNSSATNGYGIYVHCTDGSGYPRGVYSSVDSPNGFSGYFSGGKFVVGSGNVGIGIVTPTYKLDVTGAANLNNGVSSGQALLVNGDEALWYNGTYFSWGFGATYNYFAKKVTIGSTANPSYMLYVAGSAYATGTWSSSDVRYKKNIAPISNALENIQKIRGTSFEFRKDEFKDYQFAEGRQFGFIAQELEKVFPEMVNTDSNGYKSVNYSEMIPVLLEAVKEQQNTIQKMGAENDLLKAENEQLKLNDEMTNARLNKIEALIGARAQK